ncbi:ceramide kinase-like [Branchiostoma floridae]|uniref:Ceramide kinase-like n=2 Tax=Branchiostoma floridae TaxID=7739 RepID=A0A9J7L6F2_BRAFL|nr:ceramide kinase-like [Branchiostoma floridae]
MADQVLARETFLLKNRQVDVTLSPTRLSWYPLTAGDALHASDANAVDLSEVIAVTPVEKRCQRSKDGFSDIELTPISCSRFAVHYVQKKRGRIWRPGKVTFKCPDPTVCREWIDRLQERLNQEYLRPRRLLVFVNPFGGKKRGVQIYQQKVAPLFDLARIKADVIVTERAGHARDLLQELELNKLDGIVCVGGDGMFSEILNGLITRTQQEAGVDKDWLAAELVRPHLRIGIIPAGSTDAVSYATVGVNDPVTSALHIIIGDCQPLDVSSVHYRSQLLRYNVSFLGYGFYGDVVRDSDLRRWMGPTRYDYSGFKKFCRRKIYEGEVAFLPCSDQGSSPYDQIRCTEGCLVCKQAGEKDKPTPFNPSEQPRAVETFGPGGWQRVRGRFIAINAATNSCACKKTPKGVSPSAHLADGCTDLILIHATPRYRFLGHLLKHLTDSDRFNHSFIEVYRVREFKFRPVIIEETEDDMVEDEEAGVLSRRNYRRNTRRNSVWNCDGEIIDQPAIDVKVHCQLIKLFARGIEETKQSSCWPVGCFCA